MIKYMTEEEQHSFWQRRDEAREARDKRLASLSFAGKIAIVEKLQADSAVLQSAKRKSFGLGELPLDACNALSADYSSTGTDWWLEEVK